MRYFRATPEVYESFRATLDAAYGYPSTTTLTETSIAPVDQAPIDQQGRAYIAVAEEYCEFQLPSRLLGEAIAAGTVEEIDEASYLAATL